MTQDSALAILKTGVNVFLTGEPGSGKTHTINEYTRYLRARRVAPAVTASTGIAATHIGGLTIHSWGGIGIKKNLSSYDLDRISSNEYVAKRIRGAKVLIIDEVSMLSADTLAMVDAVCREIRQTIDPFGGLQVIMVGDFFQLPPVVRNEPQNKQATLLEVETPRFAYDSPSWKRTNFMVCYLTEQHRQDDKKYFSLLTAIRQNNFSAKHLRQIKKRKAERQAVKNKTPKIYSHNVDVDLENDAMLAKLKSKAKKFVMTSSGSGFLIETLKKGCLSPEILSLKVGAEVMFTKNNPKEGFVNGTLGTVEGFEKLTGLPVVRTRDGQQIFVTPLEWTVEENGQVRARIEQIPLRLAWAITVHKSQGMSLDSAVVDLSEVFEFGQGYVALSRVRRFSGLHLLGWNERSFQVHPEVLEKDKEFRDSSEAALVAFAKLSEKELRQMHHNFINACGGENIPESIASITEVM